MSVSSGSGDQEPGWLTHTEDTFAERAQKRRRTSSYREVRNQETGLMRDGDSPGLPRFVGSGSGIYFVRTVYDILARSTGQLPRTQSQLVPGEDDQLENARESVIGHSNSPGPITRTLFWRDDEVTSGRENVSFEALVAWTRNYFSIWHPAFPFLHGPEILEMFEKVANNGIDSLSGPDVAIIRAMVSISLADARQLHSKQTAMPGDHTDALYPVPLELLFSSLDHVASSVLFVLGTPASLKNLQAALCVELFLVSMLKFNMASRLGGSIVRMAYHLGLHRCPRRYPNFSSHDVSMRKRIWWSFYCLERLLCQALGLPLDVQDDDVDVCFPTSELHQNTAEGSTSHQDDAKVEQGQLQILTMLSKHAQLRGMILELRHKSLHVRRDTTDRALSVQSKLSRWVNDVHEVIMDNEIDGEGLEQDQNNVRERDPVVPLFAVLLSILQHESTIALNRPLLAKKPATPASQAALEACIHASRAIIETLDDRQILTREMDANDLAPIRAIMTWPLITWSVWMSCFILAFAALEGVTSASSAQRYAKRSLRILKQLSKRGTAWPDTCARAVEQLMAALEYSKSVGSDHDGPIPQPCVPVAAPAPSRPARSPDTDYGDSSGKARRQKSDRTRALRHTDRLSQATASTNIQPVSAYDDFNRLSPQPSQLSVTQQIQNHAKDGGLVGGDTLPNEDLTLDMNDQGWLFDPLSALDFSNFAQAGSADSAMGFTFY